MIGQGDAGSTDASVGRTDPRLAALVPGPTQELLPSPSPELLPSPTSELRSSPVFELLSDPAAELLSSPTSELLPSPTSELLSSPRIELLSDSAAKPISSPVAELPSPTDEPLVTARKPAATERKYPVVSKETTKLKCRIFLQTWFQLYCHLPHYKTMSLTGIAYANFLPT